MSDSDWNLVCAGPSMANLRKEHLIEGAAVVTVNRAIQINERGIKVHFAAFADGPSGCWGPLGLERIVRADPAIQLWVTLRPVTNRQEIRRKARWRNQVPSPNFLKAAIKLLPEPAHRALVSLAEKYLMHPEERFFVDAPGPPLAFLWDRELPACIGIRVLPNGTLEDVHNKNQGREAFTSYCALDRIFQFKPKRIRILCCDMAGTWAEDKTEEECNALEQAKVTAGKSPSALDRWAHERHHMHELARLGSERFGTEIEWVIPT